MHYKLPLQPVRTDSTRGHRGGEGRHSTCSAQRRTSKRRPLMTCTAGTAFCSSGTVARARLHALKFASRATHSGWPMRGMSATASAPLLRGVLQNDDFTSKLPTCGRHCRKRLAQAHFHRPVTLAADRPLPTHSRLARRSRHQCLRSSSSGCLSERDAFQSYLSRDHRSALTLYAHSVLPQRHDS